MRPRSHRAARDAAQRVLAYRWITVWPRARCALRAALESRLQRVEWDATRIATRLFPFVRADSPEQPCTIMIDPRMGFGRPVIAGTGIRTSIVAERFHAGESAQELALDYNVTLDRIEDAVRCEFVTAA